MPELTKPGTSKPPSVNFAPAAASGKPAAKPPTSGRSFSDLPAFDAPQDERPSQSGWDAVWLNCGVQVTVAFLTVSMPLVFKAASQGFSQRSSPRVGAVQTGGRGGSNLDHPSFERIDAELRHKNELRDLWRYPPLVKSPSGEYIPSPEEWLNKAADLYESIKCCQRITREAIRDATNTVATVKGATDTQREVLLPAASRQRFIEFLLATAQDPEFEKFLKASNASRFQPYPPLPSAWPTLAVEALLRELMEVERLRAVRHDMSESVPGSSWWSAFRNDK
jgi:hypothetical protein